MFFIRSICPQASLVHPEEKWHNKFAVWWMTAPLCVSCNGAGDKEPSGRPIRALLFDKYGLVRCLKRWPGFIEPAISDTAKWVTGKLEAKEEAVRWHVGYRVWPMKWRNLEVRSEARLVLKPPHLWPPAALRGCDPSLSRQSGQDGEPRKKISLILSIPDVPCVCGVSEVEEKTPTNPLAPLPTSSVTHCANEWTMAIHQSSKPACLAARNQLQCPSWGNLIPSADSFIRLTSFASHHCFLKAEELHPQGQMAWNRIYFPTQEENDSYSERKGN